MDVIRRFGDVSCALRFLPRCRGTSVWPQTVRRCSCAAAPGARTWQHNSLDHDGVVAVLTLAAQSARRSSALTADLARANRERQSEHSTAAQRLHALASELQAEQHACASLQQVQCSALYFRSTSVNQCASDADAP